MNKEDSFKEKFKQAILSTVKVISEDNFSNPKNKKHTYYNYNIVTIIYQQNIIDLENIINAINSS